MMQRIGNGGFSLRRREGLLRALTNFPPRQGEDSPEDLWYQEVLFVSYLTLMAATDSWNHNWRDSYLSFHTTPGRSVNVPSRRYLTVFLNRVCYGTQSTSHSQGNRALNLLVDSWRVALTLQPRRGGIFLGKTGTISYKHTVLKDFHCGPIIFHQMLSTIRRPG